MNDYRHTYNIVQYGIYKQNPENLESKTAKFYKT